MPGSTAGAVEAGRDLGWQTAAVLDVLGGAAPAAAFEARPQRQAAASGKAQHDDHNADHHRAPPLSCSCLCWQRTPSAPHHVEMPRRNVAIFSVVATRLGWCARVAGGPVAALLVAGSLAGVASRLR